MQINTLGRVHKDNVFDTFSKRKKIMKKEIENLALEGRNAIESPLKRGFSEAEDYQIKDKKIIVDKIEMNREEVKLLIDILMSWMNKILEPKRIIVQNISEDLCDGQILHELARHICRNQIDIPEVAVSEIGQKQKIKSVLEILYQEIGINEADVPTLKWNVDDVYDGNIISTLCLLVKIVQHFDKDVRLPLNVTISATKIIKEGNNLVHTKVQYEITGMFEGDSQARIGRDSFDTLFASAPDKIADVQKSLIDFVNSHFRKLDIEIRDLESEFKDGIYFIYLMGLLGNYYVPEYCYKLPAQDLNDKRENVNFVYELMEDAGIMRPKSVPDDIVLGDLKSTMRVLYAIFSHFKDY